MRPDAPSAPDIARAQSCARSGCECIATAKRGHGLTHCPAHDDSDPSFNVREKGGAVLVKCHAGCAQSAVIEALRQRGLWPERGSQTERTEYRYTYERNGAGPAHHVRVELPGQDKRMWWEPKGVHPDELPLYRAGDLAGRPGELVLVTEGEKKADLAAMHGFLAVSFAGGASQKRFGVAFQGLRDRDVVLLPDNDEPGREVMRLAALQLLGVARSVRTLEIPGLPAKGDVADFFAEGGTADDLRALLAAPPETAEQVQPTGRTRPRFISAPELLAKRFPPQQHVVEGMLMEGAMILAGKPKLGKTWLGMGLALGVAAGGRALGTLGVDPGEVLCLLLEDGERRAKDRLEAMLAGEPAPAALTFACEWRRLPDGGMDDLEEWLREHARARLVVIDTLKRIRPAEKGDRRLYDLDYDAVGPLADVAKRYRVCILIVHHTRKAEAEDVMDTISGSTGLTGSVDGSMVLKRRRGEREAELVLAHRDLADSEWGLRFEESPLGWTVAGTAEDVRRSGEQRAVLRCIAAADGDLITSREIGQELGRPAASVRRLLGPLRRDGLVMGSESGYQLTERGRRFLSARDHPDQGDHPDQSDHRSRDQPPDRGDPGDRDVRPDRGDPGDQVDRGDRPDHTSNEGDGPLCPNDCGIDLREGWCPACGYQEAEVFE